MGSVWEYETWMIKMAISDSHRYFIGTFILCCGQQLDLVKITNANEEKNFQ
jgi:hypothetical protein